MLTALEKSLRIIFIKNYYLFWVLPFYMMIAELAGCDKGKREFVSVYCLRYCPCIFSYLVDQCLLGKAEQSGDRV